MHAGSLDITPGPTSIVRLMGEHDDTTERLVREALLHELALDRNVVVSLERVSLLGSQVIGTLVAAQMVAEHAGLLLALVVPEGEHRARRSLTLTGLLESLTVYERMPEALRASASREIVAPLGAPV
jgi:anti-anti-sigma factor